MTTPQNGSSAAQKMVLVIIDFEDHSRGGHFGNYLRNFCVRFASRFGKVVCCTPNPEHTRELFTEVKMSIPGNVFFMPQPKGPRRHVIFGPRGKCTVQTVLSQVRRMFPGMRRAAFVMWGFDLLEGRLGERPAQAPWGTFADMSWTERGFKTTAAESDAKLKSLVESRKDCAVILCWDSFRFADNPPKRIWIPSIEHLTLPEKQPEETVVLASRAAGRPVISGLGILSGIRCVDEMLRLTRNHPDVFFLLAGKPYRESVNPELAPMLDAKTPENLMVIPKFLPEALLNSLVLASDGLFVDGMNYPVHSSVACKALHFGKFLVSRESNSWTCDAIRKFDAGLIYKNGEEPRFTDFCNKWKATSGRERSLRAAKVFMGEDAINKFFDKASSALAEAAGK
jgi:hypothetical protein